MRLNTSHDIAGYVFHLTNSTRVWKQTVADLCSTSTTSPSINAIYLFRGVTMTGNKFSNAFLG